jgi:hypothetical protein
MVEQKLDQIIKLLEEIRGRLPEKKIKSSEPKPLW